MSDTKNNENDTDVKVTNLSNYTHQLKEVVDQCEAITYSLSSHILRDAKNPNKGKIVTIARNNYTGQIVITSTQDLEDVHENGLQLPSIDSIISRDKYFS